MATDTTSANYVVTDPFWPWPYPTEPQPYTVTNTTWLQMPQRLADEDVERIAQRVAELIKPKRRKRSRK
jgi:hypothetical protein